MDTSDKNYKFMALGGGMDQAFVGQRQMEGKQAFLEFRAFEKATFRGGLLILPISHMNLYHEPVYFHSVERPDVDRYLVPSTWRELGASVSGELTDWLSYELQLNNSLSLTDSDGELKLADVETEGRLDGDAAEQDRPDVDVQLGSAFEERFEPVPGDVHIGRDRVGVEFEAGVGRVHGGSRGARIAIDSEEGGG